MTKNISITDEIYFKLLKEKRGEESFTDVIAKLLSKKGRISDYFGKWEMSDEEAVGFKEELASMWKKWEAKVEQ